MLVDLTPRIDRDPLTDILCDNPVRYVRIMEGVYEIGHWNPEFEFSTPIEKYWRDARGKDESFEDSLKRSRQEESDMRARYREDYGIKYRYFSEIGVCDNPMQVLAAWPHIVDDPEKYAITVVRIRRDEQGSWGGWRWHKWGPYIGVRKPSHEYLYNEKNIDQVFTFHIHKLKP